MDEYGIAVETKIYFISVSLSLIKKKKKIDLISSQSNKTKKSNVKNN
jgi:hypothetical protein